MTLAPELHLTAGGHRTRGDCESALAAQHTPPDHLAARLGVSAAKLEVYAFRRGGFACHARAGRTAPSVDKLSGVFFCERGATAVIDLRRHPSQVNARPTIRRQKLSALGRRGERAPVRRYLEAHSSRLSCLAKSLHPDVHASCVVGARHRRHRADGQQTPAWHWAHLRFCANWQLRTTLA